jgi:hypothetical protein
MNFFISPFTDFFNAECKMQNAECRMQNAELRIKSRCHSEHSEESKTISPNFISNYHHLLLVTYYLLLK